MRSPRFVAATARSRRGLRRVPHQPSRSPRRSSAQTSGMRLAAALLAPVAVAIVAVAGCRPAQGPPDPDARTWIRNMWTGPAVLPQAEARPAPAGSMAVDAPRILNRREARTELVNPLADTPETIAEGEALYRIYCALCHGYRGDGDGELARHYRRMPPLTAPHVLNYPDGFLYAIIREGGRNMPRFGDALSVDERWALVHYLGTLGPRDETAEAESR